jgi:hypothetical protein
VTGAPLPGEGAPLPGQAERNGSGYRISPEPAQVLVSRYRELDRARRSLRLLQDRLLRDLVAMRGLHFLGVAHLRELAEIRLGMSERTARSRIAEADLFEDEPRLRAAYEAGDIGVGQAFLIHRVALPGTLDAFLARAVSVTHRQFEREVRFHERLHEHVPTLAMDFRRPLPQPGLEEALTRRLLDRGWSRPELDDALDRRGLRVEGDGDPAVDPRVLRRLETLLEWIILAQEGGAVPAAQAGALPIEQHPDPDVRQTLALPRCRTTVRFWLPETILEHWERLIGHVKMRWGPLPTWAAATMILEAAVREWERQDPSRIPTEWRILERDAYRCQVPGCTSRKNLEVHHLIYQSRSGPDDPWNLITHCHTHHHHRVHGPGTVKVYGNAPGGLTWELGARLGRRPWIRLRGEKILHRELDLQPPEGTGADDLVPEAGDGSECPQSSR